MCLNTNISVDRRRNAIFAVGILTLFVGVFWSYTRPFDEWYFCGDSYSVFHNADVKSYKELGQLFTSRSNSQCALPSNMKYERQTFFGSTYRPLVGVCNAVQATLVGFENQRGIFFITIILFAVCVCLLFMVLLRLGPPLLAFAGAIFFAFHSTLGSTIGSMFIQVFYIGFILLLLSILCLAKWIDGRRIRFLVLSCVCYLVLLLKHELFIVYPVWLLLAVPTYLFLMKKRIDKSVLVSSILPFWIILASYILLRISIFPVDFADSNMMLSPFGAWQFAKSRILYLDFIPMVLELLGLRGIPSGWPLLKALPLFLAAGTFLVFFIKSQKRLGILVFLCGTLLFLWPSFVRCPQPYYSFIPLAFFVAAFVLGASDFKVLRIFLMVGFFAAAVAGFFYNMSFMHARQMSTKQEALTLRKMVAAEGRGVGPIMFVGVPETLFCPAGVAQAIWLMRGDDSEPVYVDSCLNFQNFTSEGYFSGPVLPRKNLLEVSVKGKSVRMCSLDKENLWFPGGFRKKCSLGTREVHEHGVVAFDTRVYDTTITIDEKLWSDGLRLMTWDSARHKIVPFELDKCHVNKSEL